MQGCWESERLVILHVTYIPEFVRSEQSAFCLCQHLDILATTHEADIFVFLFKIRPQSALSMGSNWKDLAALSYTFSIIGFPCPTDTEVYFHDAI